MNERLIKIAHLAAVVVIALTAVIVVARQGDGTGQQNSNGNQQNNNSNTNANGNTTRNTNDNGNENTGGSMNSHAGQHMNSHAGNTNRGGGGQTGGGAALGSNDRKFVMDAAMAGMAEVELGRLAVARGASDAVKQFGQRMVDDHTRANEELMQLASGLGVTLPTALDAKHRAMVDKMSRLSGAEFDRAYAKQMVTDHQKAVSLFQREAERGANPDLKSFASGKLPALQEHLRMARGLAGDNRGR